MKSFSIIKNKSTIKYSFFIVVQIILMAFFDNIYLNDDKSNALLSLLVSTISITNAILITFFFSKLFSEKQDRIQRKSIIDNYSKKITELRKISHHLKTDNEFWSFTPQTKSKLDNKYSTLTIEEFRNSTSYTEYEKLTNDLNGEIIPQAYLSLRGLENNEISSYTFYNPFNIVNYSLNDLYKFKECCGHIWYFLDAKKQSDLFSNLSLHHKESIKESYFKITNKQTSDKSIGHDITNLYSDFSEKIIDESYYLTNLNEKKLPIHFVWISINIIFSMLLLIFTVLLFSIDQIPTKSFLTTFILSFFISNTIDLIIGFYISLKDELKVTEFYKI